VSWASALRETNDHGYHPHGNVTQIAEGAPNRGRLLINHDWAWRPARRAPALGWEGFQRRYRATPIMLCVIYSRTRAGAGTHGAGIFGGLPLLFPAGGPGFAPDRSIRAALGAFTNSAAAGSAANRQSAWHATRGAAFAPRFGAMLGTRHVGC